MLDFDPDGVGNMTMLLTEDIVVVPMTGTFGWAEMPFTFGPVTRALTYYTGLYERGESVMIVDDKEGVSLAEDVEHDMQVFAEGAKLLLGPTAINDKKSESGWRIMMDYVGWDIDLDLETVTQAEKNLLKSFYDFSVWSLKQESPQDI